MKLSFENDNFDNYIQETIKVFSKYSVQNHLNLLKIKQDLVKILPKDHLWVSAYNPYLDDMLTCSRVVTGIVEWNERKFFLNLLEQLINRKITVCQFYHKFELKCEEMESIVYDLEDNQVLTEPPIQSAMMSALVGQLSCTIFEEEEIWCICNDWYDKDIINFSQFYLRTNEIYRILKELIECEF